MTEPLFHEEHPDLLPDDDGIITETVGHGWVDWFMCDTFGQLVAPTVYPIQRLEVEVIARYPLIPSWSDNPESSAARYNPLNPIVTVRLDGAALRVARKAIPDEFHFACATRRAGVLSITGPITWGDRARSATLDIAANGIPPFYVTAPGASPTMIRAVAQFAASALDLEPNPTRGAIE